MALVTPALRRFDIALIALDPTVGSEIKKTRPCLVISPDEMNRHLNTLIIAPMTTATRPYPTRVPIRFQRKDGQVALDQLRTVDKARIIRRLGAADRKTAAAVVAVLLEVFALESA